MERAASAHAVNCDETLSASHNGVKAMERGTCDDASWTDNLGTLARHVRGGEQFDGVYAEKIDCRWTDDDNDGAGAWVSSHTDWVTV